jgi:uncharacterized protein YqeY
MATLTERIEADYRTALKAGERLRVDTLRLIKAGIQRAAIDKRKETLEDADVITVLSQQAKQRRETMEAAKSTERQDIFTQATQELAILSAYLPQQLSDEALRSLIDEAVRSVGGNQGQIMKFVMAKAAGAADGKRVSQLVAERLQASKP